VPEGYDEQTWLREQVHAGLRDRFRGDVPEAHTEQADYEVDVICQMGFPGYFLVTADLCRYAKETGIRVGPGRGLGGRLAGRLRAAHHRPRPDQAQAAVRAASSTPSASRCPTSTSTSTSAGAAT
jgi:DNA polymerase-3 subunit alpha